MKGPKVGQLTNRCGRCMDDNARCKKRKRDHEWEHKMVTEWLQVTLEDFLPKLEVSRDFDLELQVSLDTTNLIPIGLTSKEH
ncbi:hypothetical protein K439DRAFT_334010 [Ramaria rubella]|nr:hypothetical protein K439DRAFT_334010 [Ramaria rubella]